LIGRNDILNASANPIRAGVPVLVDFDPADADGFAFGVPAVAVVSNSPSSSVDGVALAAR
jgi:hypothetical protein